MKTEASRYLNEVRNNANDYRYFPEPDLPPMVISMDWVEKIRSRLAELPDARKERFVSEYGLPPIDANILIGTKPMADYFEECVAISEGDGRRAKAVSTWLLGDFSRLLNAEGTEITDAKVTPETLSKMLDLIEDGTLSGKMAKDVFEEMFQTGKPADQIVEEKGLAQISDSDELSRIVAQAINENPDAVADFASGKKQALGFLVGQVMKTTKGSANPGVVNTLLREQLQSKG